MKKNDNIECWYNPCPNNDKNGGCTAKKIIVKSLDIPYEFNGPVCQTEEE